MVYEALASLALTVLQALQPLLYTIGAILLFTGVMVAWHMASQLWLQLIKRRKK